MAVDGGGGWWSLRRVLLLLLLLLLQLRRGSCSCSARIHLHGCRRRALGGGAASSEAVAGGEARLSAAIVTWGSLLPLEAQREPGCYAITIMEPQCRQCEAVLELFKGPDPSWQQHDLANGEHGCYGVHSLIA
jgi:hypothetical protein